MSESDIPNDVLEHFKKVRDDSGISISRQIKMRDEGYKIVKGHAGGSNIHLKCNPHELLEYTGDEEYSLVGNIIAKDGMFISAEIIDNIVITLHDIYMVREFLSEVEKMIMEAKNGE